MQGSLFDIGLAIPTAKPITYSLSDLQALHAKLEGRVTLHHDCHWVGESLEVAPTATEVVLDFETYPDPTSDRPVTRSGKATKRDKRALCYWRNKVAVIGLLVGDCAHLWVHPTDADYRVIRGWFCGTKPALIGANLYFDLQQLKHHVGIDFDQYAVEWDVVLVSQLLWAGLGRHVKHSLKAQAKRYLGLDLDKTIATSFSHTKVTPDQIAYNVSDLKVPLLIRDRQKLEQLLDHSVARIESDAIRFFAELAYQGMPVDKSAAESGLSAWREYTQQIATQFRSDWGISISAQSKQLAKHLQATGFEYDSTAKDLLFNSRHAAAAQLLAYRNAKTFVDTFIGALSSDSGDGWIHCDYSPVAREGVGRSSSTKRADGTGRNLQNIPNHKGGDYYSGCEHLPSFRDMIKPQAGCSLVTLDLAGAHQAISVTLSGCQESIDLLYGGTGDSHSRVASLILELAFGHKISPEEIAIGAKAEPPDPTCSNYRQFAKQAYYSVLNGATEFSLGRTFQTFFAGILPDLDTSPDNLKRLGLITLHALSAVYPKWFDFIQTRPSTVKRKLKQVIPGVGVFAPMLVAGYPYWVELEKLSVSKCTAVNWQRIEGLIIKGTARRIRQQYGSDLVQFLLFEHDSLVLQVPDAVNGGIEIADFCQRAMQLEFYAYLLPEIRPMPLKDPAKLLKAYWGK